MKKYFSFAIASLLMAAPMFLSSCGDDDDLFPGTGYDRVVRTIPREELDSR